MKIFAVEFLVVAALLTSLSVLERSFALSRLAGVVVVAAGVALMATQTVAWYSRERNSGELVLRLTQPVFSHWYKFTSLAIVSTIFSVVDFSFRLTKIASDGLWLAASGSVLLLWTLTLRYPAEIRAWGIQVGPRLLSAHDIARCTIGSDFVGFESRPGTAGWRRVTVPIDPGEKAAVTHALEKLLPAPSSR